jgi:hypothetical protein
MRDWQVVAGKCGLQQQQCSGVHVSLNLTEETAAVAKLPTKLLLCAECIVPDPNLFV